MIIMDKSSLKIIKERVLGWLCVVVALISRSKEVPVFLIGVFRWWLK